MNALIRFKLTLTEDTPAIKPYLESRWAELPDCTGAPVKDSLVLLRGLHARWARLLRSMTEENFNRELYHPEHKKAFKLWEMLAQYAWHCEHHLAHIRLALGNPE